MGRQVALLLSLGSIAGSIAGTSPAQAQQAPACGPQAPCAVGYVCLPSGVCSPIAPQGEAVAPPPPQEQPQGQPQPQEQLQAPGQPQLYVQPQPYPQQPPYAQPQPYAPAYGAPMGAPHVVERANLALIITGSVLLGVSWVSNIFTGLFAGLELFGSGGSSRWDTFRAMSLVPVAGPWAQLAAKPTSFDQDDWGTWLIINGLLQAGGLTMLIIGIATPSRQTIYARRTGPTFVLAPYATPSAAGLTLAGTF